MKTHTTVSVENYLLEKARKKNINVSAHLDKALRKAVEPKKSDIPEDSLILKCSKCFEIVDYGYYCQELDFFQCSNCEELDNHHICQRSLHLKHGDTHEHARVPNFNNTNDDLFKKVAQNGYKEEKEVL